LLCKEAEKRKKDNILAKEQEKLTTKALMKERREKEAGGRIAAAVEAAESRREVAENFKLLKEKKDAYGWQGPGGSQPVDEEQPADRQAKREAKLRLIAENRQAKDALAAADAIRRGATQQINSDSDPGKLPVAPWRWKRQERHAAVVGAARR